MSIAYLVVTICLVPILTFSGIGKLRRDPHIVRVINEVVGVPLKYFPLLAACEFLAAAGLLIGIWVPSLGALAGAATVAYFVGAVISHLRVRDFKEIGPAAFLLTMAVAALVLRLLTVHRPALMFR